MTRLEIILTSVLTLSIIFNIGIFVYARSVVVQLLWISEEIGDLQAMITSFSNHAESVYEMEMFYGDETLQGLMDHARSLDEQLGTFEYVYSLTENEEINTNDTSETTDEET